MIRPVFVVLYPLRKQNATAEVATISDATKRTATYPPLENSRLTSDTWYVRPPHRDTAQNTTESDNANENNPESSMPFSRVITISNTGEIALCSNEPSEFQM